MPSDDVSDLRDVVDAINKLCDTMKTSSYDEEFDSSQASFDVSRSGSVDLLDPLVGEEVVPEEAVLAEVDADPDWYVASQIEPTEPEVIFKKVEHYNTETWRQSVSRLEVTEDVAVSKAETYVAEQWSEVKEKLERNEARDGWSDPSTALDIVSPESVQKVETLQERWSDPVSKLDIISPEEIVQKAEIAAERWSDSTVSLPGQIEEETVLSDERQPHEFSEMYYTASSEVSLLSDLEVADKPQEESVVEKEDDRKECVIAGHVAAMRERFESMTRTNTPCPDMMRSVSPALDVFRNITPSPDRLG